MLAGSREIHAVSASRSKVRQTTDFTPRGQVIGGRMLSLGQGAGALREDLAARLGDADRLAEANGPEARQEQVRHEMQGHVGLKDRVSARVEAHAAALDPGEELDADPVARAMQEVLVAAFRG